ncbi:hypothetical protein Y032_0268g786 [Ancylostoma ceylanicum]|nr:hypothetical protein Y032_0268g786 [Ancylostoma ceylanicum]
MRPADPGSPNMSNNEQVRSNLLERVGIFRDLEEQYNEEIEAQREELARELVGATVDSPPEILDGLRVRLRLIRVLKRIRRLIMFSRFLAQALADNIDP